MQLSTCSVLVLDKPALDSVGSGDWRLPFITYLRDPSARANRKIRWAACKYVLIDDELYRRTIAAVLLNV